MNKNLILYKYTTSEVAKIILRDCQLRASSALLFNDPFDLSVDEIFSNQVTFNDEKHAESFFETLDSNLAIECDDNEMFLIISLIQKTYRKMSVESRNLLKKEICESLTINPIPSNKVASTEFIELLKTIFSRDAILCFSKRFDINPMWAHYAENHYGIVIGFRPSAEHDSVLLTAKEMIYTDVRPMLYTDNKDSVIKTYFLNRDKVIKEYVNNLSYGKSSKWSYEEELRVILPLILNPPAKYWMLKFYPEEIHSIYLGCRIKEELARDIIELSKRLNPKVKIYKMMPDSVTYNLLAIDHL